jgi:hypothetical protein
LEFIEEYRFFRKTWFNHKNKENLAIFLESSINITWKLISVLNTQLNLNKESDSNYLY